MGPTRSPSGSGACCRSLSTIGSWTAPMPTASWPTSRRRCRSSPSRRREMSRALTVSRVRVRPENQATYLGAVGELAGLAEGHGWHLWIFRHPTERDLFLECSESRSPESHRAASGRPADQEVLEERIRAVAVYEPGAWELWEEVR